MIHSPRSLDLQWYITSPRSLNLQWYITSPSSLDLQWYNYYFSTLPGPPVIYSPRSLDLQWYITSPRSRDLQWCITSLHSLDLQWYITSPRSLNLQWYITSPRSLDFQWYITSPGSLDLQWYITSLWPDTGWRVAVLQRAHVGADGGSAERLHRLGAVGWTACAEHWPRQWVHTAVFGWAWSEWQPGHPNSGRRKVAQDWNHPQGKGQNRFCF